MFRQIIVLSSKNSKNIFKRNSKTMIKSKSTPNIFPPKEEKYKTSSYYQKLYSKKTPNNDSIFQKKKLILPKKISLKKVFQQPIYPKPKFQFRRITIAKSPFTPREKEKESKEEIKERIKLSRPSRIFHTFLNIQWLRRKFSENVINKSLYTLLPNNGKPVIPDDESEEDKKHRLLIEFLEEQKQPVGKEKYIDINPKYFFNKETWGTVQKLRQIFCEFDADGNRRFELDEMQEMFESNKISASINDLVDLFFKGKKFKQSEIMKLYLNFHQFINFGLTKDKEFREFMRNTRKKLEQEKAQKNNNKSQIDNENPDDSENSENDDEEKGLYLPMDFKSLLDYFVDRGKQRDAKEVINKAIKDMNEIINLGKQKFKNKEKENKNIESSHNNEEEKTDNNNSNVSKRKTFLTQKTINPDQIKNIIKGIKHMTKNSDKNLKEAIESVDMDFNEEDDANIDYDKQLSEIDFNQLINEFSTLFSLSQIPKRKAKNQESNIKNELIIEKAKEKIEQEIINEEKNQKEKNDKKSEPQTIINTLPSIKKEKDKDKDNFVNNLIQSKSKSISNIKMNKQKALKMNDFRTIDKYINIPMSHSYFNRNMPKINKRNQMCINYISRNSSNNFKMSKYLEFIQENNKNSNKIFYYRKKENGLLPSLSSTKNQNKSMTNILFSSKGNFAHKNNIINLNGGKINLFNFDLNKKIPKSSSKMDYVPACLLFKNESALPF